MKKSITLKQFIINNLRKASYKWGPKNSAKRKAKIDRNQYLCNHCKKIFPNKYVKLDHINPVVDPYVGFPILPDGRLDWTTYIERMFCGESGYQLLCDGCHDKKTAGENLIRKSRIR